MRVNHYKIPSYCLFFKYFQPILLENSRRKIIENFYQNIEHKRRLNEYIKNNITQRNIFEWSSYTSSSDTSDSYVSIGTKDSDWIDMKKLL